MRYLALACDYDGTIASDGVVAPRTIEALMRVKESGRRLLLVTGRELPDLRKVFPELTIFDYIVSENGALLYQPSDNTERLLAAPPPPEFVEMLKERKVTPLSVGKSIVATVHPHETTVLETIRDLGLELQVIFNKGSVMVLPNAVNKATGLAAALEALGLSPHNVVGVGDAENDHAFLQLSECAVAVANAVPTLLEQADLVMPSAQGAGVRELVTELLQDDLKGAEPRLTRHHVAAGTHGKNDVMLAPYGRTVLIAGASGSGKSTLATGLLERLADQGYQFCLIDPEGDYQGLENTVTLGEPDRPPSIPEILQLLQRPSQHVVVNLLGLPLQDRPSFFAQLLPHLQQLRTKTGRPHWIAIDEAHHLLPAAWGLAPETLPLELDRLLLITVHPDQLAPPVLAGVNVLLVTGQGARETLAGFARRAGGHLRRVPRSGPNPGEALAWLRDSAEPPFRLKVAPSRSAHRRHSRKYAEGTLDDDLSFHFRGPEAKLNLKAQNLALFIQLGEGLDDETWLYHLRRGDYSSWFRHVIKNRELAQQAAKIEQMANASPAESRKLVREAIERFYTLPYSSAYSSREEAKPAPKRARPAKSKA